MSGGEVERAIAYVDACKAAGVETSPKAAVIFDAGHASRDEEVEALEHELSVAKYTRKFDVNGAVGRAGQIVDAAKEAREQGRRDVLDALHDLETLESQEWEQLRAKLRERGEK